jgi:hypothetical protein
MININPVLSSDNPRLLSDSQVVKESISASRDVQREPHGNSRELDGYLFLRVSGCELPEEVVRVNISGLNLNSVNAVELSLFTNVSEIVADDNQFTLEHLSIFEELQRLSLMNNRIVNLVTSANFCLPKLEHLDLSLNRIRDLEFLSQLENLRTLSLAKNALEAIPYEFVELRQLQSLDLSFNKISEETALDMWSILSAMPALRQVNLSNNKISTIQEPRSVLQKMSLHKLDLSDNLLGTEFDVVCLANLGALGSLNLCGNHCVVNREKIRKSFEVLLTVKISFSHPKTQKFKSNANSHSGAHYSQIPLERIYADKENLDGQRDLFGFAIGKADLVDPSQVNENIQNQGEGLKANHSKGFNIKSGFYGRPSAFTSKAVFMTETSPIISSELSAMSRREIKSTISALGNDELVAITAKYLNGHTPDRRMDTNSCFKVLSNYFAI